MPPSILMSPTLLSALSAGEVRSCIYPAQDVARILPAARAGSPAKDPAAAQRRSDYPTRNLITLGTQNGGIPIPHPLGQNHCLQAIKAPAPHGVSIIFGECSHAIVKCRRLLFPRVGRASCDRLELPINMLQHAVVQKRRRPSSLPIVSLDQPSCDPTQPRAERPRQLRLPSAEMHRSMV